MTRVIVLALFAVATASQVSPVEKVIGLLDGMKTDITNEGTAEATTYGKFACFCKDTTATKSKSVVDGQDTIDKLSASIAEKTSVKAAAETSVQELKGKKEALSKDLEENTARCAVEKAEYEGIAADLNKALSSLKSAIKAMSDKKTAIGNVKAAALFQMNSDLRHTLDLADAMGFIKAPMQKAFLQDFSSFLQKVDPNDSDYKYHSKDIVDLLESLKKDFTDEKSTLDTEFGKTSTACTDIKKSISGKIETNGKETKTTDEKISKLGGEIGVARGELVESQDLMKDDETYLKDLTGRCENRAVEYDQRSTLRNGEIEAISTALKVLGDKVKPADTKVNTRALLQAAPEKKAVPVKKEAVAETKKPVESAKPAVVKAAPSFLQRVTEHSHEVSDQEHQEQLAKEQAVMAIKNEGLRLKSPVLTALAMRAAADPFKKVKELIQGLVERLIKEAAGEATKKGFCDTEMGKAGLNREFRWTRVKKLTAAIQVLVAKEDMLTEEIASLGRTLDVLGKAVVEDTKLRKDDKKDNQNSIETATNGLAAVNEALLVLRSFYKEAAKAAFVQTAASPVDEDTAGAGFSGAYQGKQGSSNAVLGLLETIASDFERTIRSTESSETQAAEQYVKTQRATKADIGGKETKKALDEQDLKTTKNSLAVKRADMQTNMDLVDDAVKTLLELKPTCVDSGMSYTERVAKREEEVKALKGALCLLDTNKVEAECQ